MEGVVGMVCGGHLNDKKEEGLVLSEGVRGKRSVQTNPLSELPQTGNPSNERRQVDVAAVPKILSVSLRCGRERGGGRNARRHHDRLALLLL